MCIRDSSNTATDYQPQPKTKPVRRLRGNPRGGGPPMPVGFDHPKHLKQDLAAFGFSAKQVKAIAATRPAFEVDATAQRPQGHKAKETEEAVEREMREEREEKRVRKGNAYEPLCLVEGSSEFTSSLPRSVYFHIVSHVLTGRCL